MNSASSKLQNDVVRVCYFGTYTMEEGYPRNRVIIEGLRRNGVEVTECHEDFWKDTSEKLEGVKAGYIKTTLRLLRVYLSLIKKFMKIGPYDAMIVGYAGHIDIFLAKFLNILRHRPIIFDAFLSLYDTAVIDRKIVQAGSLKAKLLRMIDTWSCRMADAVMLDTQAHINYFVREFKLPSEKFHAVPVGSALTGSYSNKTSAGTGGKSIKEKDQLEVLYFGSYIPLHGVDVIIRAAKILQDEKDIIFTMIGKGQLLPEMKRLASDIGLKNINFIERFVEEAELVRYIQKSDICLGIFGQTDKALRVIPCKVYNCLDIGKSLITARNEATEGVLSHKDNAILCRPGDADDLAKAILILKNDAVLRDKIARNGREYFVNNFSSEAIGKKVLEILQRGNLT